MRNHLNEQVVFYKFHPYEKKTQQAVIKLFIHIHFKWVKKLIYLVEWILHVARQTINAEATNKNIKINYQPFFTFFSFTSDVQNKYHHLSPNSHWTITVAALPRIKHIRTYETNITWTTQYHIRWISTIHEYDPKSWRWRYQVSCKRFNNRIEGDFEEESVFED